MALDAPRNRHEPLVNAPWVVAATCAILVLAHLAMALAPESGRLMAQIEFALIPARFDLAQGDVPAAAWMTLLSSALLHGGWLHALVNAGMLLALGAPPARHLGTDVTGAGIWLLVFLVSVAAGSLTYVALVGPNGPPAVGASGGVSGMFAASFLLHPQGGLRSLLDREFLGMTAAFALSNLVLVLIGPIALGAGVAWQAHAGGYVGGAMMMTLVGQRARR